MQDILNEILKNQQAMLNEQRQFQQHFHEQIGKFQEQIQILAKNSSQPFGKKRKKLLLKETKKSANHEKAEIIQQDIAPVQNLQDNTPAQILDEQEEDELIKQIFYEEDEIEEQIEQQVHGQEDAQQKENQQQQSEKQQKNRNKTKIQRQQFKCFSFEEIQKMFEYFESQVSNKQRGKESLRNLLLWRISFFHALRVGEATKIMMADIAQVDHTVVIKVTRQKGGCETRFPLDKETYQVYQRYLLIKPDSDYLFPQAKDTSEPLTIKAVDHICKTSILKMNLGHKTMNFHKLRFSACTYLICNLGYDVQQAATVLGHKKIQNTQRYCTPNIDFKEMDILNEFQEKIYKKSKNPKISQITLYNWKQLLKSRNFEELQKQLK